MANNLTVPTVIPKAGEAGTFKAVDMDMKPAQEAMNQYVGGIQKAGDQVLDAFHALSLQQEQAEVKEAFNKFSYEMRNYANENYFTKKNKELVDSYQPTLHGIYEIAQKYEQGMSGSKRRLFIENANQAMRSMSNDMNGKYWQGVNAWNDEQSKAMVQTLAQNSIVGINNWTDPNGTFTTNYDAMKGEISENLIRNGYEAGSVAYKQVMLQTVTKYHTGNLDLFLDQEDVSNGRAYLKGMQNEMDPMTYAKYEARFKDLSRRLAKRAEAEKLKLDRANRYQKTNWDDVWNEWLDTDYRPRRAEIVSDESLSEEDRNAQLAALEEEYLTKKDTIGSLKQESTLTSAAIKNDLTDYAKNQMRGLIQQGVEGDFEDMLPPSVLSQIVENDLYDPLKSFWENRGVEKMTTADNETYEDIMTRPDKYTNKTQTELKAILGNFTEAEKNKAIKAIQNASRGNTDGITNLVNNYLMANHSKRNASERSRVRQWLDDRAAQLDAGYDGVLNERIRQEHYAIAMAEFEGTQKDSWFGLSSTSAADVLIRGDDEQRSKTYFRDEFKLNGQTVTVEIPTEFRNSPEGREAYKKAQAQAELNGQYDARTINYYAYGLYLQSDYYRIRQQLGD